MITIEERCVEFSFYRPDASRVAVAGDFCGWNAGAVEMYPDGDGNWRVSIELPEGEHAFRYCADGEWFPDYAAHGFRVDRFGKSSLVRVTAAQGSGCEGNPAVVVEADTPQAA